MQRQDEFTSRDDRFQVARPRNSGQFFRKPKDPLCRFRFLNGPFLNTEQNDGKKDERDEARRGEPRRDWMRDEGSLDGLVSRDVPLVCLFSAYSIGYGTSNVDSLDDTVQNTWNLVTVCPGGFSAPLLPASILRSAVIARKRSRKFDNDRNSK